MKRIFFALCILAVFVAAPRHTEAATDVSIDFFYDNLGDDGSWVEVGDYGYCWQPNIAVSNTKWRPYSDGYWAYTDVGWTWVSNERFGWATYHYGRWARLHDHGWVWVPGREWGPAWVSWRTGGDYVGWAPLPPRRGGGGEIVYEGRPVDSRVDVEFDIGPAYYNFVDVRYIGEPVLRDRIFQPEQNVTYITRTVNVTNITYNNSTYYNYGPDYNRLSAYSTRQIPRLTLERENNVDLSAAARSGGLTKVLGERLMVAAPVTFQKLAQQVAPKVVKTKIGQPKLESGWAGVTDPKAKAELQQKIKTEDPKTVPPPDLKPTNPAALNAASPGASPAVGAAPVATAPPAAASPPTAFSPVSEATPAPSKGDDKSDKKRGSAPQPTTTPATGTSSPGAGAQSTTSPNESKRGGRNQRGPAGQLAEPTPGAAVSATGQPTPDAGDKGKKLKDKPSIKPISTPAPMVAPAGGSADQAPGIDKKPKQGLSTPNPDKPEAATPKGADKGKKKNEAARNPRETDPPIAAPNTPAVEPPAKHQGQPAAREPKAPKNQPAGNAAAAQGGPQGKQGAAPEGQGKPAKGKKGKAEEAPSPAPGQ